MLKFPLLFVKMEANRFSSIPLLTGDIYFAGSLGQLEGFAFWI